MQIAFGDQLTQRTHAEPAPINRLRFVRVYSLQPSARRLSTGLSNSPGGNHCYRTIRIKHLTSWPNTNESGREHNVNNSTSNKDGFESSAQGRERIPAGIAVLNGHSSRPKNPLRNSNQGGRGVPGDGVQGRDRGAFFEARDSRENSAPSLVPSLK